MKRLIIALAAAALGGCASIFQAAYDDQTRAQCEDIVDAGARNDCLRDAQLREAERDALKRN